jgi:hypothetical protein
MFYTFNEKDLNWKKANLTPFYIGAIILGTVLAILFYNLGKNSKNLGYQLCQTSETDSTCHARLSEPFSEKALVQILEDLNVKFPHIVLAQAMLETGHFKSDVFKQNNNLFGMKEAKTRQHTAVGTNLGHACYDTWQESVIDYALYQARYLSHIKTESDYLLYLNDKYAESTNYDSVILEVVDTMSLRELFT